MAEPAHTAKHGVIGSVLVTVGWIIVHLLSFPVVIVMVFFGITLSAWLWNYSPPTKDDQDPPSYAEASGSNDTPAQDGAATTSTATSGAKTEESTDTSTNLAMGLTIVAIMAHAITLLVLSDGNYDTHGNLLPNGWTVWQRIGASLFAIFILVVSVFAVVAVLKTVGWVTRRVRRATAGKSTGTAYHKLEDLEPTSKDAGEAA